ncbi:MAG: glycoside hydrolase family 5 protein [Bacteroidales bacterium]|nr:glycoside hydrolase family 5 protein [Bacteroidales bacterium]
MSRNTCIKLVVSCFTTLATCLSLMVACSDDSETINVPESVLSIPDNVGELSFLPEGSSQQITIEASNELVISPSVDYVVVTVDTLEGNRKRLNIFCRPNDTNLKRYAEITLTEFGRSETINISQGGATVSSAMEICSRMTCGINIGNTLEVPGNGYGKASNETAWGNPAVNEEYIRGLKRLGFNAVRIPCAWHSYSTKKAPQYTIDPDWMKRVTQVVDWCIENDLYVVLNSHWDEGWLENNISKAALEESIVAEQRALWSQIAVNFRNYDEHLIFAGCNEPGYNETNDGTGLDEACLARLIRYEQVFIDAVRLTGGNNATRCLVVQGPSTNIDKTVQSYSVPTDEVRDRLIVEVHYYDPYNFCLMTEDTSWGKVAWYWGEKNHKEGSAHNATWGEEDYTRSQFQKMQDSILSKGLPVIIGEFSAQRQTAESRYDKSEEFDTELHNASRKAYNQVVAYETRRHGCIPFYWETGGDINRTDGTAKNSYAIEGLIEGVKAATFPY